MNTYKVGDKVLYYGEVHTVIQVPDDKLTWKDVGYLHKDYVVLDLNYDAEIHYTNIEPYKTPHERLLKFGWKMVDTDGTYKMYNKLDYKHGSMSIEINKDERGWYFTTHNVVFMGKELTTVLLEYLDELELENE